MQTTKKPHPMQVREVIPYERNINMVLADLKYCLEQISVDRDNAVKHIHLLADKNEALLGLVSLKKVLEQLNISSNFFDFHAYRIQRLMNEAIYFCEIGWEEREEEMRAVGIVGKPIPVISNYVY